MRKKIFFSLLLTLLFAPGMRAQYSAADHFDKGMSLYEKGMWSAAHTEFIKAVKAATKPEDPIALRCDCMTALSAAAAGLTDARALLENFIARNPHSIYSNEARFALAGEMSKAGEWDEALRTCLAVDPSGLSRTQQDEYHFRTGYAHFMTGDEKDAYKQFMQVGDKSVWGPPAIYYTSYINYAQGSYTAAKTGFGKISSDPSYGPIVPFYLIQIEFLQGNYSYVTSHGDELIKTATRQRAAETARITGEAWYRTGGHREALRYMELYRSLDGAMGREEAYIEGYCRYMTGDCAGAAEWLAKACSADDALSQNAGYHLGACYLKLGEKRLAMQSFSIASAGRYDEAIRQDALFNYGKLQYELGGGVFNEAINVLNRYISEYPSSDRVNQAREYLISAYYNSRDYEAAYNAIMLIPNPDNNVKAALQKITYFRAMEYFNAGDLAEAQRLLDISARNRYNAKYTALATFWKGEIRYRHGDYSGATSLYKEYLAAAPKSEPEYAMALYGIGYSYFNLKNWREAEGCFDRFLATKPAATYAADTYNRMGDIRYSAHSFWQAMEQWEKAAAQNTGERYYALWRRAVVLGMVDRTPRKIESLQAIVSEGKGPYVDAATYELGRTYMGQERFQEAASTLEDYVRKFPSGAARTDALSDLGLVYQNLGRSDKALAYYKQVVSSAPGSPQAKDAMTGIRSIYVENGDVDGYFSYAEGTGMETDLSIVHRDSLTFAAAERMYLASTGDPKSVGASLQNYLANYPRGAYRAPALFYLADCRIRASNRQGAEDAYRELSGMYYNDYTARALENLARMKEEDKDHRQAMDAYLKLGRTATVATTVNRAFEGALRSARLTPQADIAALADEILASPLADKDVLRQAQFIKAKTLPAAQALAVYEKLAVESQSAEGAESAYRVIEARMVAGDMADARKRVFALSEQNSPHTYWTGKAFLALGGIYKREGDAFQARATYQSIVDGYPVKDDGIVDEAKEAIKNLK